jgi:hypothetical protein
VSSEVSAGLEQGLLGLAFAPDGEHLYINLTDTAGDTHVIEYAFADGAVDLDSRREVLVVEQPLANHNAGSLVFGPDGYLYIGLGDGGGAGDPEYHSQRLDTLLGSMLRIDPRASDDAPYTIPDDNPFVPADAEDANDDNTTDEADAPTPRPEIWAYGLRNPWKYSFDRATGDLWIADVGQSAWEEINVQRADSTGGENYGWNHMEGFELYAGRPDGATEPDDHAPPIYAYENGGGRCSLTGGFVYRGEAIEWLQGAYVYADWCEGLVRYLREEDGEVVEEGDLGVTVPLVSSFGEDHDGELYAEGTLRPPDGLPFDPSNPSAPSEVPYDTWDWVELLDPYGPYPSDVATTVTTEGKVVPAIARVETRTINRGITRVAILDDPAARGPDAPFETPEAWNGKVLYNWGASCGIGRQQGINTPNEVLSGGVDAGGEAIDIGPEVFRPAVLQGYLVPHSSLTIFNTHCNQVLSAETMMMVREHLIETYGRHDWVMGNGASGGAIQQYTTMNSYPGLQDGGLPLVSFPDVVTTAMSPADCRLLRQLFAASGGPLLPGQSELHDALGRELPLYGPPWTLRKRNAITGHDFQGICEDWDDMFADLLVADKGCSRIPNDLRYSRETKTGERCTLQDNLVHFMGVDPETGFARRPIDNVGVQYGYQALLDRVISVEEFLFLNRHIGSYDDEGYGPWDPGRDDTDLARNEVQPRMAMDPDLAHDLYRYGFVTGRGAIDQAPIIDVNLYADPVPILGFHDQVRGYVAAERIEKTFGVRETHSIWSGVVLTNDAWPTMHRWLDAFVEERRATGGVSDDASWTDEVATARPVQGGDACVVTTAGYSPVPLAVPGIAGDRSQLCEQVFGVGGSPRIAAGGPTTEDVVKCRTTAPRRAMYPGVTFTDEQWAELNEIFADGVCDWTVPGVGEVERSETWLHWGNADMPFTGEPTRIPHVVARTR